MSPDIDLRLNVRGECCPLPLIQIAKAIKNLKRGQTLEISGNDPIFETSMRDFCRANGHAVLDVTTGADHSVSILIRVGG
jgi:tRNA 2-thiouridine synthesizing protein A